MQNVMETQSCFFMSAPQLFQNTSVFDFIHKCIQYNYHCDYPSFLQAASANGSAIPLKLISVLQYKQVHLQNSQFELLPAYRATRWQTVCSHTWCQERSYITNVGDLKLKTLYWRAITNSSIPILELHSLNSMKG